VSTSTTDYDLGGDFKVLDISGKVRSSDIALSYPFIRSRAKNVIGAIQYRETTTKQKVFGLPFSESSLPLATISMYTNWVDDDSSATALNIAYSTNFWHNGSDADQDKVSSKLDTDLTYLTGATRNWDFYFHSQGVYSSASLPDTEKFSVGGPDSVRGYGSSEIRGDKGYLVTMELRRQWRIGSVPGYVSTFVDMGGTNNRGFEGYDRIASAGVGLVFYAGSFAQFKAEYATPLTDWKAGDGKNDRVWFNFSMGY
jgi:hemolysin activation/secretion protein